MKNLKWEDLILMKKSGEINRLGVTFSTDINNYFYDTGTGKVIALTPDESIIINDLFEKDISIEQLENDLSKMINANEFLGSINKEHLLMNPTVKDFIKLEETMKEDNLQVRQLVIELTGKCNLRCKYCIYNDYNERDRDFNTEDITFDTAKKAIDYAYKHKHPEDFAVTFYGGEPLINFNVMKQCIEYCLDNIKDCNLTFSVTTNLTLISEEIADYLAKVPNLSILLSLDGPEDIHNAARVYASDRPSFKDAFDGLKRLAVAVNKYKNTQLGFNCVLMPPYTNEKFERISDFFATLDFLPKETNVQASYPQRDTIPQSYIKKLEQDGDISEEINWTDWAHNKSKNKDFLENKMNLYSHILQSSLAKIHNRVLLEEPLDLFYYNGCCIPGQRRLYVCTDGTYKVCERVGSSPTIGHVDTGLDVEAIKKYYLKDYKEKSIENCSKCWAIRLCDVCYADCYEESGLNSIQKDSYCKSVRNRFKIWLKEYYSMLEEDLEIIGKIDKIKLV